MKNDPFVLEAFVDFPDDALKAKQPITPEHLDAMMRALKARGVRRVGWGYYGDGHGGWFIPTFQVDQAVDAQGEWTNFADTYQLLGNPLKAATEAAHRHGIELYAYYKPYETGCAVLFPEGSPEAQRWGRLAQIGGRMTWMERFVVDHPELRIKRKTGDIPADVETRPICALRLMKEDDSPTRLTKEHIQIWTSKLNYKYERLDVDIQVEETIESCPRDINDLDSRISAYFLEDDLGAASAQNIRELDGRPVARKGDRVRVLTLSGFEITDPYLVITTDFTDGPGDFENTGVDMLVALDADGNEIPGVFATGGTIWNADRGDFCAYGLNFDYGFGRHRLRLDEPVKIAWQGAGLIGYARGRNAYLPGALCEMEPAVRAYWRSCVQEMLDAGVDGIDFREENHSMHTDYPEEYGYNDVVLAECERRGESIAKVRGDAYTDFLREAKVMIAAAGKKMRYNLQIDWYRADPPGSRRLAYPGNMEFQWRRWIDEGLMDEAILRFFHYPFDCLYQDEVALDMIDRCRAKGLPMTVNRYILQPTLQEEYRRIREDDRFAGFILYETWAFMDFNADNSVTVTMPEIDALAPEKVGS